MLKSTNIYISLSQLWIIMAQLLPSANIYENKKQIIAKMGQSTKTVREEKKGVEGERKQP